MNSKHFKNIILVVFLLLPAVSSAAFTPLVGIPGITDPNTNFGDYINALYALSISIAGLLAVIKIIIAGVKYMLSDVVTSKQDAIGDIKGALLGLLIVLAAYLILYTINPDLTKSNLFTTPIDKIAPTVGSTSSSGSSAPLPQIGSSSTGPVTVEQVTCASSNSCAPEESACVAKGGKVETSWYKATNISLCRLGDVTRLYCEETMNTATQQLEMDCTTAKASCTSPNIYTQTGVGTADCFKPY